jgi:hypothetical protein
MTADLWSRCGGLSACLTFALECSRPLRQSVIAGFWAPNEVPPIYAPAASFKRASGARTRYVRRCVA